MLARVFATVDGVDRGSLVVGHGGCDGLMLVVHGCGHSVDGGGAVLWGGRRDEEGFRRNVACLPPTTVLFSDIISAYLIQITITVHLYSRHPRSERPSNPDP